MYAGETYGVRPWPMHLTQARRSVNCSIPSPSVLPSSLVTRLAGSLYCTSNAQQDHSARRNIF